jgi:hypothetical protein
LREENAVDVIVQRVRCSEGTVLAPSHCCEKIHNLYSKIQLLNRQQIDVDLLYVDVYVLQNSASDSNATIPSLLKDANLRNDFDRLGLKKRDKRSPGFEVATKYPRLMVLGKPGSGKTTFLRHLAVANCKGEFLGDRIPVLIEFRFIANISEFNLINHIHKEFRLTDINQTQEILQQGKVLIFLDGLDEISNQFRLKIQNHIIDFSRNYYNTHLIITCRTQTSEYTLSGFDYVEVADFNSQQVEQFAKNWFTALAETQQQAIKLTQRFIAKLVLPENKQTAELAVTPILLSLVCWIFNDLQDLPTKRSDLYERGIDLLLSKWDERRGISRDSASEIYRQLTLAEKKQLLSYIAKRKFEQEQYILFEQSEIQEYIAEYLHISNEDAEVVLIEIEAQHGLLIERSQGIWSFSHLTFQEYLVAKWFCQYSNIEDIAQYFIEKHWREVYLLTSEIIDIHSSIHLFEKCKQTIDTSFLATHIQELLINLYHHSEKSKLVVNEGVIRAFYLDISFLRIIYTDDIIEEGQSITPAWFNLPGSKYATVIGDFMLTRLLADNIFICFDFGFISYNPVEETFGDVCKLSEINTENELEINLVFANLMILLKSFTTDYAEISSSDIYNKISSTIMETTKLLCSIKLEDELKDFLQQLMQKINLIKNNTNKLRDWFKFYAPTRIEDLHKLMKKYGYINWNWDLTQEQLNLRTRYYEANILFVECLKINDALSNDFKEEIIKTLLLPISEIEKRKSEQKIE